MKKVKLLKAIEVILIAFCFLVSNNSNLFAESNGYGIFFGFTGSKVDGSIYTGYNKLGITGGFFVNSKLNEIWSVQAEPKYIMKGAAMINSVNDPTTPSSKLELHYIELPILLKATTSTKIEFESGLAEAYLVYSKQNFVGNSSENISINKTDLSGIAGISYLYTENIVFNLKFSYSLKRISYLAYNITIFGTYGQYNNVFEFAVYYKIK